MLCRGAVYVLVTWEKPDVGYLVLPWSLLEWLAGSRAGEGGGQLLAMACFSTGARSCPLEVVLRSQGWAFLPSLPVPRHSPRPLGPPPGCSVLNVQGQTRTALGRKPGLSRALSLKHSSQAGGEARPWLWEPLGCYSDTLFSSDGNRETKVLISATFTKAGREA